jgi:hypothetical protein
MSKNTLSINKECGFILGKFFYPHVICASSSRHHKNMSFFYGDAENSLENRKNFLSGLGIDHQSLVCAKQVHGCGARYVQEEDMGKGALSYDTSIPDTDAFVTDKRNLPLAIFTADCLSIFLYEPETPAIGLIHAGWRSTKENIVGKTVQLMKGKFNIRIENLYVGLGPAIRECCYEVGKEFSDFLPSGLIEKNGRRYFDLVGSNKKQLLSLGVRDINIFDSQICTSCQSEDFFSYRKEGKNCGRLISVMMLK